MSYIQNNLQTGEEIRYKADIHWYIFVSPAVLLLLGTLFSSPRPGFFSFIGGIMLLVGIFQLVRRLLLKMGNEYVVTNKKIILKSGFFSCNALELVLNKCEGLQINQSALGRIFGFGSIVVTTGGATNVFKFVANPMKFRNEINSQIQ